MKAGRRVIAIASSFVLAVFLLSIGTQLAPWGLRIVIVILALALLFPVKSVKATLHTSGVAHHVAGDPTGPAGIGAVLRSESGELIAEIGRSIGVTTNTVADYTALIEGLEMALEKGVGEVAVYVDSPLIAGHLLNEYGVRADHLRPLVEQVRQLLDRFSSWSLTRVPRNLNLESDLLAHREIEQLMPEALGDAMHG